MAREAVQAAIKQAAERVSMGQPPAAGPEAARGVQGTDFSNALESGIQHIDQQVQAAESLPLDLLTGKVDDFHQIAVQLKSAELSFKFAMEIRNKLVDAYREIMRMSV